MLGALMAWCVRAAVISAFAGVAACAGAAQTTSMCSKVGSGLDIANLQQLYAEHGGPLVLVGEDVLLCGCGQRKLGGDTEGRKLGGDTEGRKLGGDTEERKLGGDTEERKLGGDTEERRLGGDTEERRLGGDTEERRLGGEVTSAALQCVESPPCLGFVVRGAAAVRIYDGKTVREAPGNCVE